MAEQLWGVCMYMFIEARDAYVISFWVHARKPVNYYFQDFFRRGITPLHATFAEKSFANFFLQKWGYPTPQLTEFCKKSVNLILKNIHPRGPFPPQSPIFRKNCCLESFAELGVPLVDRPTQLFYIWIFIC